MTIFPLIPNKVNNVKGTEGLNANNYVKAYDKKAYKSKKLSYTKETIIHYLKY